MKRRDEAKAGMKHGISKIAFTFVDICNIIKRFIKNFVNSAFDRVVVRKNFRF